MAKHADVGDGDLPPPYSLSPEAGPSRSQHRQNPRSLTSHLQSQVASVHERIQHGLLERYSQQFEADVWLIDQLAPVIEEFLVDVGAQYTTPPLAVLTLVPSEAVPANAELSDLDDMRHRGEFGRAAFVPTARRDKKGSLDSKAPAPRSHDAPYDQEWVAGSEFTDWGRWDGGQPSSSEDLFWWRDEGMARRLASYLRPEQPRKPVSTPRTVVQASVERELPASKPRGGWGWGRRKDKSDASADAAPSVASGHATSTTEAESDVADLGMHMNVTAEQVTFRHANNFGILESSGGWAIVATVRMSV